MPRSDNKEILEFKKLVRQVMKKKSVSKSPLAQELQKKKKKSRSRSSVKASVRSKVRARSVKNTKNRRRRSSVQQAGAVRDGSHQRFPRCR